jgi:hypothetical protein
MSVFLRVIRKLLDDQDLDDLPKIYPPRLPSPVIPLTDSAGKNWESTARTNTLRPYLDPPVFSFSTLKAVAESRYDLAVEHLIDLRTEPSFFAEQLGLVYSHRLEFVCLDAHAPQSIVQGRAIMSLLSDPVGDLAVGDSFSRCIDNSLAAT